MIAYNGTCVMSGGGYWRQSQGWDYFQEQRYTFSLILRVLSGFKNSQEPGLNSELKHKNIYSIETARQ